MDYYAVLSVPHDASEQEIKQAYRKLAKVYHPDKSKSDTGKFLAISEAYKVLVDPQMRAAFDNTEYGGRMDAPAASDDGGNTPSRHPANSAFSSSAPRPTMTPRFPSSDVYEQGAYPFPPQVQVHPFPGVYVQGAYPFPPQGQVHPFLGVYVQGAYPSPPQQQAGGFFVSPSPMPPVAPSYPAFRGMPPAVGVNTESTAPQEVGVVIDLTGESDGDDDDDTSD